MPAVLAVQACGRAVPTSASSAKHDVDSPTRPGEAWNWVTATPAQYRSIMAPLLQIDASTILPTTHKLTKRVQMWLDMVDTQLRTAHPQALASVPKPQAQVVIDATANAFVAPAPVCYKVAVQVKSGTPTSATRRDRVILDVQTGELSDYPASLSCIEGANDVATLQTLVAEFNAVSSTCQYAVEGSGANAKLVPNAACSVNADLGNTIHGDSLVVLQTANWVTVHTGIFSLMDEDAFVAVLSHELGHYYRSHITAHESIFGFYYTLDQENPGQRPVADATIARDGEKAFAAATMLGVNDYFNKAANQTLRSELFLAVGSLVKKAAALSGASPACKTAWTLLSSPAFSSAMSVFPFDAGDAALYANFEAKSRACLATLTVKSSGDVTANGASWSAFEGLVAKPVWPAWYSRLPDNAVASVDQILATVSARLGAAPTVGETWESVLATLSQHFSQQDEAGIASLRIAHEKHIGQYTMEQEADEEAAEWIAKLGFDPKAAVDAMHELTKGQQTSMGGMVLGQTDCEALYNNDWRDAQGSYQFVPVGDYSEVHHSTCYRMFNLTREIAAHHEVSSGATLPPFGGSAWKSLQDLADDESGARTPSFGPSLPGHGHRVLPAFVKRSPAFDCVYASQYR